MLQVTEKITAYKSRENWSDYSLEKRELGVKKSVLDFLSYYADLNEITDVKLMTNNELKNEFSIEDFKKENVNLSLFVAGRQVKKIEITENYISTGNKLEIGLDENGKAKTKAEIVLENRQVTIHY